MDEVRRAVDLAKVGATRSTSLVESLSRLDDEALFARSELPGWNRLTIVCHLRYGASAMLRMTRDALAGRPTAYYPEGRLAQRPGTLEPSPADQPRHVVASLATIASALDDAWASLGEPEWVTDVVEPIDNVDLGTVPLGRLALARLLEVDVHGTDLGIGFPDWSETMVDAALPVRLRWLATRRPNHRDVDRTIQGSWQLAGTHGLTWLVRVDGDQVRSRPADPRVDEPRATLEGSARDLLALLLGRNPLQPLRISGDVAFGNSFTRAFPGL